ncbi:MAG: hypothetical protein ACXW0R_08790 [Gaiellaceae bacterium]
MNKSGIESVIDVLDGLSNFWLVVIIAAIAFAAIGAGGTAGWVIGLVLLVVDGAFVTRWLRRKWRSLDD